MTVVMELAPEVEEIVKARAAARGLSLEDYLPSLIAEAAQQEEWQEVVPPSPVAACICSMRRIWSTPEEDEAWKYLEEV